ncbi:hypothetical protein [Brevibacillus daliensis]|uniref:hypothetical protein n=1 Tax=Brevibacillus daliensis TaxID=2892995 RepID=UPI001E48B9B0|nr:hypothetical protein [Brevibacillus daliensis]
MKKCTRLVFSFLLLTAFFLPGCSTEIETNNKKEKSTTETTATWQIRHDYTKNGDVLFRVYPDPELSSGKPYGYMISFMEPFETYKDKELTINAYHKESGKKITALPPTKITEQSSGYPSLNRFTTRFELPLSGLWRFEVALNGENYGDVVLDVKP